MRLHRFYVHPDKFELRQEFWVHDEALLNQWLRVLRYRPGSEVVLFDGVETERLYRIEKIEPDGVKLQLVTEFERKLPARQLYLLFSLLKKDKNEWVLQKCTELGVRNFVPIIAERSEKIGFNMERAEKIVIEAAEQCGRSDIPQIREPILLETALADYGEKLQLLVAEEKYEAGSQGYGPDGDLGVFIGPEGGWTDKELEQFASNNVGRLDLGSLTLRAETASIAAVTKLLQ